MVQERRKFDCLFNCPFCKTRTGNVAHLFLEPSHYETDAKYSMQKFYYLVCNVCYNTYIMVENYKRGETETIDPIDHSGIAGAVNPRPVSHQILFPTNVMNPEIPYPDSDMPKEFQETYNEAASIFDRSPRSSAFLIRLTLENFLKYYTKKNNGRLVSMIDAFVKQEGTPQIVYEIMDVIRKEGNKNVHEKMKSDDVKMNKNDILNMFRYINLFSRYMSSIQQVHETFRNQNNH